MPVFLSERSTQVEADMRSAVLPLGGDGVHHCMAQKNSRREVGRLCFLWTFQAAQFAAVPHAGGLAARREAAAPTTCIR